ncbi:lysylphosphatidylglycerol synthase transmembrane domain-containing protein [Mycoplasmopsis primatum]|uniref:lysylphosphatidylglycerol synthase transmembrane domain-containing protein n=1 Tax=Mycoplasmopsis primatum TaxID=55604 RepID=UPI000497E345|nr:lysylphosphatidylglycerol synthase transmembrane domain-containing protein [Mycoplasmopsis primatum]
MALNPILEKWNKQKSLDSSFPNMLWNFSRRNSQEQIEQAFSTNIQSVGNRIISDIGIGTNLINEYTITALANAFCQTSDNDLSVQKKVFLISDNAFETNLYLNIFARVLTQKNIQPVVFQNSKNIPISLKNYAAYKTGCHAIVSFQQFLGKNKKVQIAFNFGSGAPFSDKEMQKIINVIDSTDYLLVNIPENSANYIYSDIDDIYYETMNNKYCGNKYLNSNSLKLSIDISNFENKDFYLRELNNLKIPYVSVKRSKSANFFYINNQKYLESSLWKGIFSGSKINIVINEEGTGLNVCIKHKKANKYFKPDELAALYLNFLINDDPDFDKSNLSKYVIAKNYFVGSLTKTIATDYGISTYEFVSRSNTFNCYKKYPDKELLMSFTSGNEFIPYNRIYDGYDANHFMFELLRMVNFYQQEKNKDIYQVLQEIYAKYGRHQLTVKTYSANIAAARRFFQRISKLDKIEPSYEIVRVRDIKDDNISKKVSLYQIAFRNKEYTYIRYNKFTNTISLFCETIEQNNEENKELQMVIRNNEILNGIMDLKEEEKEEKFSPKSLIKYLFYVSVLIGIIIFLFYSVYNLKDEFGGGGPSEVLHAIFKKFYVKNDIPGYERAASAGYWARSSFAFMCLLFLVYAFFQAIIFKRLISLQGYKIGWKDLFISTAIGLIVQTITPKSIGGDIATYWYLRKRNIPRSVLMSSIVVNTFLWQVVNIISTVIFVPMGIVSFSSFFTSGNPHSITFNIMLILGLIFDTSLTVLLLIMTASKRIQNIIIKIIIYFTERFPFIRVYDTYAIRAKLKYELFNINNCIKKSFKNFWYFIELTVIKFAPTMISTTALQALSLDMVRNDVEYGFYINLTVQNILIRVANSVSLTPGGTGTSDYLYKVLINESLKATAYDNQSINANAAIMTAMTTLGCVIMGSLLSAILLVLVYIGERRVDFYRKKEKNLKLISNNNLDKKVKIKTNYYKISMSLFFLILTALTFTFIFVN